VLAVGDAQFQKKCLGKMEEVGKEGRTVLFVSHNMAAVRQLCNTGMLLNSGAMVLNGSIADCMDRYARNDDAESATICSHIAKLDPSIEIDWVTINGNVSDEIVLSNNLRVLEVEFKGNLLKPLRMDIELRILDIYDTPLALFSPGHKRGYGEQFSAGEFCIKRKMLLPEGINGGNYRIVLSLAEPNVEVFVTIPYGIKLIADGAVTESGRTIEYLGAGWLFIPELD